MKTPFKFLILGCLSLLSVWNVSGQRVTPMQPLPENPRYQAEADRIYRVIEGQSRYLLSRVHNWKGDDRYKLITASQGAEEHITRPNTSTVATFAFLYRFGDYSEDIVGISREKLLGENILPMMRYLLSVHKTGEKTFDNGAQWGLSWQSALWAAQFAQGAWMLWDVLPEDIKSASLKLVTAEADRVAGRKPPYRLEIDSKSEENAWDSMILSAALLLMPDSPSYAYWEGALVKWQLSAYSKPSDAFSETVVDGETVKDRYAGANIYDDYTLENHAIAHPDYMCASAMNLQVAMDYVMTGRKPLDASLYNIDGIYTQLKHLLQPGAQLVYPSGQDWAIFRGVDYMDLHAFNFLYYGDRNALHWFRECLATAEKMQARDPGGAVYAPNENFFPSAQGHLGYYLLMAWRAMVFNDRPEARFRDIRAAKVYPDGKFFVHRTDKAIHTVSWGRKVMIQSMAHGYDPMVCPDWHNGVGYLKLTGEEKVLLVTALDHSIEEGKGRKPATIRMTVMHGDAAKAEITVQSYRNGDFSVSEKLTALKDISTEEIATLYIGVLNHPEWIYENGSRTVKNNGNETEFPAMSGRKISLSGNTLEIDGRMKIRCTGEIRGSYTGAPRWTSSKLIDKLILNHQTGTKEWKAGDLISDQTVTISY